MGEHSLFWLYDILTSGCQYMSKTNHMINKVKQFFFSILRSVKDEAYSILSLAISQCNLLHHLDNNIRIFNYGTSFIQNLFI